MKRLTINYGTFLYVSFRFRLALCVLVKKINIARGKKRETPHFDLFMGIFVLNEVLFLPSSIDVVETSIFDPGVTGTKLVDRVFFSVVKGLEVADDLSVDIAVGDAVLVEIFVI